jgi:hypothetical protein
LVAEPSELADAQCAQNREFGDPFQRSRGTH